MIRRLARRIKLRDHIAETLYGTVLVTAVLVSVSETDYGAAEIDVAVVVTAFVFALTHAWAFGMERSVNEGRSFGSRPFRHAMAREWYMVRATFPTVVIMLLAVFDAVSVTDAVTIAITVNQCFLWLWGFQLEREVGGSVPRAIVAGCMCLLLGLILIAMKISIE